MEINSVFKNEIFKKKCMNYIILFYIKFCFIEVKKKRTLFSSKNNLEVLKVLCYDFIFLSFMK